MPMGLAMVITTYADMASARTEAQRMVRARLAACASMTPVTSIYEWNGAMQDAGEVMTIFKTAQDRAGALREAILAGHAYDTPEVITLDAESAGPYMDWVCAHVGSGAKSQGRDNAA